MSSAAERPWLSPGRTALSVLLLMAVVAGAGGILGWSVGSGPATALRPGPSGSTGPIRAARLVAASTQGAGRARTGPVRAPSGPPPRPSGPVADGTSAVTAAAARWAAASTGPGRGPVASPGSAAGTPAGGSQSPVAGAALAPAERYSIDLSHWYLTLPTSGVDRAAVQLTPARPSPPWLIRAPDGSLSFWTPVDGATTSSSAFARTELRETLLPGDNARNWTLGGTATLAATLKVTRVPSSTGKIIVGQVHGYGDGRGPLLMLYYQRGLLVVALRAAPTSAAGTRLTVARGIALGTVFTYRLRIVGRQAQVDIDGRQVFASTIGGRWTGVGLYFKAGVYVQATGSSRNDGGAATFYALTVQH